MFLNSLALKKRVARLVKLPLVHRLMAAGVRVVSPRHPVGVVLVLFNAQDEILLLEHVFHPIRPWGLPGGWLKRHEGPAEGAARELFEETGLRGIVGPPVLIERESNPSHLTIAYVGRVESGGLSLSFEILRASWTQPDRLPERMYPFTFRAIAAAHALRQAAPELLTLQNGVETLAATGRNREL